MRFFLKEDRELTSAFLGREVKVDFYLPANVRETSEISLLLINDGQDLDKLGLQKMLSELYREKSISPLLCVGIHAGKARKNEYGTAKILDYKGRGTKAPQYTRFIFEELLPFIRSNFLIPEFKEKAFAGFSLGGLCALDIVWNHSREFSKVGIFSGSFWWRTKDQDDELYSDDTDRIMHHQIRNGGYYPWLKFFFECGAGDEEDDRNNNGIIDSIDDTLDLIKELVEKGYDEDSDIHYLQIDDGKHDVETWARAMPEFLKWGWGAKR
ncbi:MAG TPA: alpha/beta hydrolase-fold protein [Puia sp.]|jgi:enterochelin esterase-like enzyme|nr:alpha/beta hydrolase-fold protein [Puia sp.]